jgi:hypothetical protein
MPFPIAETTMWQLVQTWTGCVGYKRGVKSEGLSMTPPVIDCSGWVGLLLQRAMRAENEAAGRVVFRNEDISALQTWSDRIIHEVEARTGTVLEGQAITARTLPRFATIGLKLGTPAWANNHPRPRGITHVVQVVRRPEDGAPFVSESFGLSVPAGISLTPLDEWLDRVEPHRRANEIWAVDPFQLGN